MVPGHGCLLRRNNITTSEEIILQFDQFYFLFLKGEKSWQKLKMQNKIINFVLKDVKQFDWGRYVGAILAGHDIK